MSCCSRRTSRADEVVQVLADNNSLRRNAANSVLLELSTRQPRPRRQVFGIAQGIDLERKGDIQPLAAGLTKRLGGFDKTSQRRLDRLVTDLFFALPGKSNMQSR